MTAFEIHYETGAGRCAWCWAGLPKGEAHTVVSAKSPPPLTLRFHHACFDAYRAVSGVELGAVGSSNDWPPGRIEALRVSMGWTVRRFAGALGVTDGTYRRILQGDGGAFGPGVRQKLRQLSARSRFESKSPIDWTDGRAVFCLRMALGLKMSALGRAVGASVQQIGIWERNGVPGRSVRTHGRLARLAERAKFAAADVVDDRLWDRAGLTAAVGAGGRSAGDWGAAAGLAAGTVTQYLRGARPIHREAAWKLTRAAVRFGVPVPPAGVVGYRKGAWTVARGVPAPEHEAKRLAALREAKWDLPQLMTLGTYPDKVLADHLGKTRNSVAIMRRSLGIPAVDLRHWDGRPRAQSLDPEELRDRWDQFRDEQRAKGRVQREKLTAGG